MKISLYTNILVFSKQICKRTFLQFSTDLDVGRNGPE